MFLLLLSAPALLLGWRSVKEWKRWRLLLLLPLLWFGWQFVAAMWTVDHELTSLTLWHFAAVLACYFAGASCFFSERSLQWILAGLLAGFVWCTIRAVEQRLVEFPAEKQFLVESQAMGWTNLPPEMMAELREQQIIVTTNGVAIANPTIVQKYERGRVFGTLVYPNALAGAVLLLLPVGSALVVTQTRKFRPATRLAAIWLLLFLGGAALFWTGSKSGWLIAMAALGLTLLRLPWGKRLKWTVLIIMALIGVAAFAVRFQSYFASGATSVGARFDYWRAAVQTAAAHPITGTGPGTFQRPYENIKAPEAEMARLAHNDYLEQFSDSGFPGGILFATWILILMIQVLRKLWNAPLFQWTLFIGVLAWLLQGLSEFSLYIPALAYPAFLFAGWLARTIAKSDSHQGESG